MKYPFSWSQLLTWYFHIWHFVATILFKSKYGTIIQWFFSLYQLELWREISSLDKHSFGSQLKLNPAWSVADPRGGAGGPPDQNFLNFMQFLGEIWQICMLAPLLEGWRPLLRWILDPPRWWWTVVNFVIRHWFRFTNQVGFTPNLMFRIKFESNCAHFTSNQQALLMNTLCKWWCPFCDVELIVLKIRPIIFFCQHVLLTYFLLLNRTHEQKSYCLMLVPYNGKRTLFEMFA